MDRLKEYYYPSSLQEALSLLTNESTAIIAGGTHITVAKDRSITRLVDIMNVGLSYIQQKNNSVNIGSTTTITEISKSAIVQEVGNGILAEACQLIGDTPLRNVITLGGNIAKPYPWAGLPVVLLVLDAKVELIGQGEMSRIIPATEFFARKNVVQGEIIKEVIFPIRKDWFCRYEKFSLTSVDYSWLTMAFATKIETGTIAEPHLAVSRITKPHRIAEVESYLTSKEIDKLDLDKSISILRSSIKVVSDYRSSEIYREHLLGVLFKRMLTDLKEEAAR
ncbi:MAG: FAD binding domain-containing protein [Candidatus Hermodarchaeota archaeon]